ncbi:hypothetical protein P43SY_011954 [Pythium insidiosum]|uniref:Uncharacterized protein n=1 Tax=Pythium insidiosum TaxID=114742 RepID=A0AAD5LQY0_PYTIN|nr:hypothetical protein P43SY_011954 [Pythium insidiosum]
MPPPPASPPPPPPTSPPPPPPASPPPSPRALEPRFRLPVRLLKGGDDFALRRVIALFTEDERHWAELELEPSLVPLAAVPAAFCRNRPIRLSTDVREEVVEIGGSDMFDVDDVIELVYTPAAQYARVHWTNTVEPFENARPETITEFLDTHFRNLTGHSTA